MTKAHYFQFSTQVLAEFRQRADEPDFWSMYWKGIDFGKFLNRYRDGSLGVYRKVFKKYLPKASPILEAGCGRGHLLYALQNLGYNICGVDFSIDLVQEIKKAKNEINIVIGDVRNLQFKDESFGAYISLGVIEHYWEGIEGILSECNRVLKSEGVLLVSVPHFSPCLRNLARKEFKEITKRSQRDAGSFYQFYFSRVAIENILKEMGFEPIDTFYYGGVYGAKRAMPKFLRFYDRSYAFRFIVHRLSNVNKPQFVFRKFAHSIMTIAIKTKKKLSGIDFSFLSNSQINVKSSRAPLSRL